MSKPVRLGAGNRIDSHGVEKDSDPVVELHVGGEIVSLQAIDTGKSGIALVVTLPDGSQFTFAAGALSVDGIAVGNGGSTFSGTAVFSNSVTLNSQWLLTADITPPSIGANQNNYNPTGWAMSNRVRLSSSGAFQITGFLATSNGDTKLLINTGGSTITIPHESASSTAANRVLCPGGVSYSLTSNSCVFITRDGSSTRWRLIG